MLGERRSGQPTTSEELTMKYPQHLVAMTEPERWVNEICTDAFR